MGFWRFIRDMLVFDWLFGHRKKESFWEQRQMESQQYVNQNRYDDYRDGYHSYGNIDYAQQDFDDGLDSGMLDNVFQPITLCDIFPL